MNNVLHARTSGQGPDIVLLHGLFGQGSNLGSVSRALMSDFRVHCLDLPDHGRSSWLTEASLVSYAAAVSWSGCRAMRYRARTCWATHWVGRWQWNSR